MRGRIRAGAFGLGCAGLAVLTLVTPAAGERYVPTPAGDIGADCQNASMNTPRGDTGDVKLTADLHDGATVAPGQDILLRLSWDPKTWSGKDLDLALQCVRVKGELDPDLSGEEVAPANDGVFEYRLHVPENIKPGCDICAEGFLSGPAAGGGAQDVRSDRFCFMSGHPLPPPPTPPVTRPPTPPATNPPAPPASAPTTTTTARIPTEVAGITATRPAPPLSPAPAAAPAPAVAPKKELPRTGSATGRTGTAGGGLALSLGGLAVIGGSGRRGRRRRRG